MAGTEFMANPSKETCHLPTCKDKALTPFVEQTESKINNLCPNSPSA
jgi:hypothetical protein